MFKGFSFVVVVKVLRTSFLGSALWLQIEEEEPEVNDRTNGRGRDELSIRMMIDMMKIS